MAGLTLLVSYTMIGVFPVLYVSWKIIKKTRIYSPKEVDLFKNVEEIEEYQRTYVPSKPK